MLFGSITVWCALFAIVASMACYLTAAIRPQAVVAARLTQIGRWAFVLAAGSVIAAGITLGTLLVTHRFDVAYVYEHSARAMAPLYWFPSFWSGQEGSFLLWALWTSILGCVLAFTSGGAQARVMPIYSTVLLFLVSMLLVRSPFLPLDTQGLPAPTEGLGLNPNLENPWMVIHPPTLFLGFSSLAIPFAFAISALLWKDWDGWLPRVMPWTAFGIAVLGLAMMMGGYWAYEMLGWGGFWGWDPVENGPLVPWLFLVGFQHAAQVQRVRGGYQRAALTFAVLPFIAALYETFLTRTGVLDKFSVHSFSTLGGVANNILLGGLLTVVGVSVVLLIWCGRRAPADESTLDHPSSREFAFTSAITILTICALICAAGMSAPLLTGFGVKMHWATHTASVKEDFYNKANFPIALLLAIGMGLGQHLAWRAKTPVDSNKLALCYAIAVFGAVAFIGICRWQGTVLSGPKLVPQLLLFTASLFALSSNVIMMRGALPKRERTPRSPLTAFGGHLAHAGIAVFLLGVVCLVTFVQKDPDVLLIKGQPVDVLNGAYTMTYLGQTSDYQTDKTNALKFAVRSHDGREKFTALLPFALRSIEGGDKKLFGHPAITHHAGGDLYLALKDGPDQFYKTPVFRPKIALGGAEDVGPYHIAFNRFERDPTAAAFVAETGQMPDLFPVTAVLDVTYHGKMSEVRPQFVMHRDEPGNPDTPEVALPGGWLVAFDSMNAGSTNTNNLAAGAASEMGSFAVRQDSGPPTEAFQLEVSTRPMIWLVWLGTLMLVAGGLLASRRRVVENKVSEQRARDRALADVPARRKKERRTAKRTAPAMAASAPRSGERG